jgi:hypothetical protein
MDPATILVIMKGIELIGTLAPVALATALKIKQLLDTPETDYTVHIKAMRDGALCSAEETLELIEAWKKENGVA